jgi:Na+/proline symporter
METKTIILLIVIAIPVLLSLISLLKINLPTDLEGFFYANRTVDSKQFIDTTVAYAFQIAAISLFATWGYMYGFWTLWVPLFWYGGYRLLKWLNDNDYLDSFLDSREGETIHGFIAKKYKWKYLSLIAGVATLIGLSGTAFFEAEFVSNSITEVIPNTASGSHLLVFFIFVLIALLYIIIGGFKAIIWTDSIQLKTGFIAILSFIGITFGKAISNGYYWSGSILLFLTITLMIILLFRYKQLYILNPQIFKNKISTTFLIGVIVLVISLLVSLIVSDKEPSQDTFLSFFSSQNFKNPLSLGFPAILSLFIANFLWQIVDISNWQRLSSYDTKSSNKQMLSKSISFASFYSPLTWIIAIFLGMAFKYVNADISSGWTVLQDISIHYFNSNILLDNAYIIILLFGMIMIMFSTLDSLISSISYTVYEDIVNVIKKGKLTIKGARIWTVIFTLFFFFFYIYARTRISEIDKILYAFYSFQIALFPTIFFLLIKKQSSIISAVSSISSGILASILVLVYIDPYVYAALVVFIVSMLFYFLPNLFIKIK